MTLIRCAYGAMLMFALGGQAAAQDAELPDFATCLSREISLYEQKIAAFAPTEAEEAGYPVADVAGIEFCGTVGIVICDRSDRPLPCQKALSVEQDIWRAKVLGELPEPQAPDGFAGELYETLYALAHDMSAGLDCAGTEPRMEMWCRAREANGRLRRAVLAWQVARQLGQVAPAREAGWIAAPAPVRPKARAE